MFRAYFLLNLLLVAVAVAATGLVFTGGEPISRIPDGVNLNNSSEPAPGLKTNSAASASLPGGDLAALWENVIFNPTRREKIEFEASPPAEDESRASPANMELLAIGVVGSRSAAVILVNDAQVRRTAGQRRGGGAERERNQRVYTLDAEIEGTGYTVREIKMDEVILSRGDEERVLRLTPSAESSQHRRSAAVRHEAAVRRRVQPLHRETGHEEEISPPPPPPAPTPEEKPAGDGEPEEADNTRDEQIRRAIEHRREVIEELRRRQRNR